MKQNCIYCGSLAYSDRNICNDCIESHNKRIHENCISKREIEKVINKEIEKCDKLNKDTSYSYRTLNSACVGTLLKISSKLNLDIKKFQELLKDE